MACDRIGILDLIRRLRLTAGGGNLTEASKYTLSLAVTRTTRCVTESGIWDVGFSVTPVDVKLGMTLGFLVPEKAEIVTD